MIFVLLTVVGLAAIAVPMWMAWVVIDNVRARFALARSTRASAKALSKAAVVSAHGTDKRS